MPRLPALARSLLFGSVALVGSPFIADDADAQTTPRPRPGLKSTAAGATSTATKSADGARLDIRSQHFLLHTDMSQDEAKDLLERLEYMLGIISEYWGRPPEGIIECYVAKDLKNWPAGSMPDETGREFIARNAGVTLSLVSPSLGKGKATVYAVAERGVPQHEAVHAYCAINFGTTGPTWYSEGMAELGQYWRKGDNTVKVEPGVVDYIRKSEPKSLNEIVNAPSTTGDSWQNYAWRWALCHLLAANPNYAPNFRPLGLGILQQKQVSFEQTYGHMADEISFEYLFFLKHICNGYRMDLCYWDWKRKFSALPGGTSRTATIQAARGWQPTGVMVRDGAEYTVKATGGWRLDKISTKGLTADGNESGEGKLVGIVFKDFKLSDEFDIGADGTFTAPSEGQLHLRCKSDWASIGDNSGSMSVKIGTK